MPLATPAPAQTWRLGTIEGFFGRSWSWQARSEHVRFLAAQGFNSYVYAPKSDSCLRKQWQTAHDAADIARLAALAAECRTLGIEFGIGLSPYELYRHFDTAHAAQLAAKLQQLNAVGADTLCILFDDMTGDLAGLAARQAAIMDCVQQHSSARRFVLCPTYYSSDPLLAKLFGSPPERYLEELGELLAPHIDIFWTGPKVISQEYPRPHLEDVALRLRRKPLLWDNYPVNDAKRLTPFLHLLPFRRDAAELRELCAGHLANPMNQAALSQIPLHTLALLYRGAQAAPDTLLQEACAALLPPALARALIEDAAAFQQQGLDRFTPERHVALLQRYESLLPAAAAMEVVDWLRGGYAFDPACLT
jgi:hypothetical protein